MAQQIVQEECPELAPAPLLLGANKLMFWATSRKYLIYHASPF